MSCFLKPFIFLVGFTVLSVHAFAQQNQGTEGSLLPDINPQDIEIRSQYRAQFPGLRRQPILGFNPRPRVYQVDPDRMPFIENYGDAVARLPVGEISRPEPPAYTPPGYSTPQTLVAHAGIGSLITTEGDLWISRQLAENHWFNSGLNLNASDGHIDGQESGFRFLNLESGYRGRLNPSTVLGVNLDVDSNMNRMFELEEPLASAMGGTARKTLSGVGLDTRLITHLNTIENWNMGVNASFHSADQNGMDVTALSSDLKGWSAGADVGRTWIGERLHETFGATIDMRAGGYNINSSGSENWSMFGLNAGYQRLFNYKTDLDGTFGFYYVNDAVNSPAYYPAGDLRLEHYFLGTATLFATIRGRPEHPDQSQYHLENPFLSPDNSLQHSYHFTGSAGLSFEFFPGNIIRGEASWQSSKNYSYYTRRQEAIGGGFGSPDLFYELNYMNATIFKLSAGFSMDIIPDVIWINSDAYWQAPRLSSGDKIPFEESIGIQGALSVRPVSRLLLEAWGDFVGSRSNPGGPDPDPFFLLGTRVEVGISERIGVYGKIRNLLNQDYEIWQGYSEQPMQIFGGITITL